MVITTLDSLLIDGRENRNGRSLEHVTGNAGEEYVSGVREWLAGGRYIADVERLGLECFGLYNWTRNLLNGLPRTPYSVPFSWHFFLSKSKWDGTRNHMVLFCRWKTICGAMRNRRIRCAEKG